MMSYIVLARDAVTHPKSEYPLCLVYLREGLAGSIGQFYLLSDKEPTIFATDKQAIYLARKTADAINKKWKELKRIEFSVRPASELPTPAP